MRIDRYPDVDVDLLPPNPSPPDFWQERAACFGVDPDVFFPISEEEAGPALMFCTACPIRRSASRGRSRTASATACGAASPNSSAAASSVRSPEPAERAPPPLP